MGQSRIVRKLYHDLYRVRSPSLTGILYAKHNSHTFAMTLFRFSRRITLLEIIVNCIKIMAEVFLLIRVFVYMPVKAAYVLDASDTGYTFCTAQHTFKLVADFNPYRETKCACKFNCYRCAGNFL